MSIFGTPTKASNSAYPVNSISATVSTNTTDLIVVQVMGWSSGNGTPGVTDTIGNTYTQVGPSGTVNNGLWFYCLSSIGTNASNVVTFTATGGSSLLLTHFVWDWPITAGNVPQYDCVMASTTTAGPPSNAIPNLMTGIDEAVMVTANDVARTSTWTALVPGAGYTSDGAVAGSYPGALGAMHGVFANPNTTPTIPHNNISINGALSATSVTLTLASVTKGSNIMLMFEGNSGYTFGAISDNQGNVYYNDTPGTANAKFYYAIASAAGTVTITIASVTASSFFHAVAAEILNGSGPSLAGAHNAQTGTYTIALGGTQSANVLAALVTITNPAPSTTVTWSNGTSTIVAQAGNSTNGYAILSDQLVTTTGTNPTITVVASPTTQAADITALYWLTSGTPWLSWTGNNSYINAIAFKAATTYCATGSVGIAGAGATVNWQGIAPGVDAIDAHVEPSSPGNWQVQTLHANDWLELIYNSNGAWNVTPSSWVFAGSLLGGGLDYSQMVAAANTSVPATITAAGASPPFPAAVVALRTNGSTPTRIRSWGASNGGSGAAHVTTPAPGSPVASGDILLAWVTFNGSSIAGLSNPTMTDTQSNTWYQIFAVSSNSSGVGVALWICVSPVTTGVGPAVTVNYPNMSLNQNLTLTVVECNNLLGTLNSGSVTADGSGNYSICGLPNGSYTITPTKTGISFAPLSQNATILNTNTTGVNFSSSAGIPGRFWPSPNESASALRGE